MWIVCCIFWVALGFRVVLFFIVVVVKHGVGRDGREAWGSEQYVSCMFHVCFRFLNFFGDFCVNCVLSESRITRMDAVLSLWFPLFV